MALRCRTHRKRPPEGPPRRYQCGGMRIPFLGVCVAHAALAGAVFGALVGLAGNALLGPAMRAPALGLADPRRIHMDDNVVMGLLFSVAMGLAFVGFGLCGVFGRSDNDVRSLLWGSLTYCRWPDVWMMLGAAVAFLLSAATDLPSGAVIVLLSSALVIPLPWSDEWDCPRAPGTARCRTTAPLRQRGPKSPWEQRWPALRPHLEGC